MNQKGFATLEIILMVVVLGILASIAVPRFTDVTTKANTAKIQSDLAALNSALAVYEMENGSLPDNFNTLVTKNYLVAAPVAPESGKYYVGNATDDVKSTGSAGYAIDTEKRQATFNGHTIDEIGKKSS